MKKIIGLLICLLAMNANAANIDDFSKQISKQLELEKLNSTHLKDIELKAQYATIFAMLAFTQELSIHQMGGATENQVFLHKDGNKEAVFDGDGKIVTDCLNMGSYNYYHPYQFPLAHFTTDILPWIILGNCKDDPSTKEQRVEAYIADLRLGFNSVNESKQGFFLPENFNFKGNGQSVAISFYLKVLETSEFDFEKFSTENIHDKEQQKLFFKALESGFIKLLKGA